MASSRVFILLTCISLAGFAPACSEGGSPNPEAPDSGTDAASEAGREAGADATVEAASDAGLEDAAPDAGLETGGDTGADAPGDAGAEAGCTEGANPVFIGMGTVIYEAWGVSACGCVPQFLWDGGAPDAACQSGLDCAPTCCGCPGGKGAFYGAVCDTGHCTDFATACSIVQQSDPQQPPGFQVCP